MILKTSAIKPYRGTTVLTHGRDVWMPDAKELRQNHSFVCEAMSRQRRWDIARSCKSSWHGKSNSKLSKPTNWELFHPHLYLATLRLIIVGLRTPAMPQGMLLLRRMSPACSVVVVVGGGGGVVGGVVVVGVGCWWWWWWWWWWWCDWWCCFCASCNHTNGYTATQLFSHSFSGQKRQIRGVFMFLETLGAKNTANAGVFDASEAQNHGISVYHVSCHR